MVGRLIELVGWVVVDEVCSSVLQKELNGFEGPVARPTDQAAFPRVQFLMNILVLEFGKASSATSTRVGCFPRVLTQVLY